MNATLEPPAVAGFSLGVDGEAPHGVVHVTGELDMLSAPRLENELARLLTLGYRSVALDLAGLTFLAAAGLAVLAGADRRYRDASGKLMLTRLTPNCRRLLALTGLDATLTIGRPAGP